MIRINLLERNRRSARTRAGLEFRIPENALSFIWAAIFLGAAISGYLWYSRLAAESEGLTGQIASLQVQRAQLQAVIEQDSVYEQRRAVLQNRIEVIENLQRNQVSPVVSLDVLSQAISQTEHVWLNQLGQNNTQLNMSGVGTSVNAIADFVSNLVATGYFRNVNLVNAQDTAGNFSFQMTCDFVPPLLAEGYGAEGRN